MDVKTFSSDCVPCWIRKTEKGFGIPKKRAQPPACHWIRETEFLGRKDSEFRICRRETNDPKPARRFGIPKHCSCIFEKVLCFQLLTDSVFRKYGLFRTKTFSIMGSACPTPSVRVNIVRDTTLPNPQQDVPMKSSAVSLLAAIVTITSISGSASQDLPDDPSWTPYDAGPAPTVELPSTPVPALQALGAAQPQTRENPAPSPANDVEPKALPAQVNLEQAQQQPEMQSPEAHKPEPLYLPGTVLEGIVSAVSGHSLKLGAHAVRLDGIEVPKPGTTCLTRQGTEWSCGEHVEKRLAELAMGETARCVVKAQSGNGALARCSLRGLTDLAKFLVAEGLAVPNRHAPGDYAVLADRARKHRVGLWTGSFPRFWQ